jgi:selenium metabolism protein YedF
VLLVTSDKFGTGDDDLGELLMASFINTLTETCGKPDRMLFINSGVMLALEGSRVVDTLKELEEAGIEIFSCGTCLNHYQVKDKLAVGKVTNMYDTVDTLLGAEKVIRI